MAALRRKPGIVSVVVRCSSTGFVVDHFSGDCVFGGEKSTDVHASRPPANPAQFTATSLYGKILFHRGRFCRVDGYDSLHSRQSAARLSAPPDTPWFARHLPSELVLGDTASRDAALHSIQACIPHRTILPVSVERIVPSAAWTRGASSVHAVERSGEGDDFIYDVRIEDTEGRVCEQWQGLHLRAVAPTQVNAPWPAALLVPYLERRVGSIFAPVATRIGLAIATEERCSSAVDNLVREIFGPSAQLAHRPDGKPHINGAGDPEPCVSLSRSTKGTLLFVTDGAGAAGCDLEAIIKRTLEDWESLLGTQEFALAQTLRNASKSSLDDAATQVWSLKEALRKAGAWVSQPISYIGCAPDGWATFSAGNFKAATFHTCIEESACPLSFAFVIRTHHESI